MRRQIPGLHLRTQDVDRPLEGLFLVRVDWASYRWHPQKPFVEIRFLILEPTTFAGRSFQARLYCTEKALWKRTWFLRDFGYDVELLGRDQVDETALRNLRRVVRPSCTTLNGRSFVNLEAFAPAGEWEELSCATTRESKGQENRDDL